MSPSKILFKLSGSIACYKACSVISALVQEGHEVQVVSSAGALQFVGPATLEGLTGRRVMTQVFEEGRYMDHISLADWCDRVVLCPASASMINRLAHGIADDLIGSLFLAHDQSKPYHLIPAMNTRMWEHPSVQASLLKLREWDIQVMPPAAGRLACGAVGEGKLPEPDDILRFLSPRKGKKILITGGGTCEPIDSVRVISNNSSGKTAATLADYFAKRHYDVTYAHGLHAKKPTSPMKALSFQSHADLERLLKRELEMQHYDAVIHLAAVSDYTVKGATGKMPSGESQTLELKPTRKIVDQIRTFSSNSKLKLVAFKLTDTRLIEDRMKAVQQLLTRADPDWVVHNDLSEVSENSHCSTIHDGNGLQQPCYSRENLAQNLDQLFQEAL